MSCDSAPQRRVFDSAARRRAWVEHCGRGHDLKYRLAFVVNGECVVHYDNEAGKGDQRHAGSRERAYRFESIEKLLADFERDIARWRDENPNS